MSIITSETKRPIKIVVVALNCIENEPMAFYVTFEPNARNEYYRRIAKSSCVEVLH
jgi:hypothetical protein